MSSVLWKFLSIGPMVGMVLLLTNRAMAAPHNTQSARSPVASSSQDSLSNKATSATPIDIAAGEPTSASESEADRPDDVATDIVKPGDWQYTALQKIAIKYGCNANLNNRSVSQLEFARGLNACLSKVEPMLAQQPGGVTPPSVVPAGGTAQPAVTQADLEVLNRLTQEYRAQLTELDGRLVATDKKVAQLQANQFSTTTKLKGEAVFNVTGLISGGVSNNNVIFGDRVRLLFQSSFTGKDILWTRLATGNQPTLGNGFRVPSPIGSQVIDTNGANSVGLDWLAYQFPIGNATAYVAAFNGLQADYAPTFSVVDDFTGATQGVSAFGEDSPIYKIGGGSGAGVTIPIADTGIKSLSLGYFAFNANRTAVNNGVFGTDNSLLAQLNFQLSPKVEAGLTYINSSHDGVPLFGGAGVTIGTNAANNIGGTGITRANSYGAAISFKPSDTLSFSGFVMTSNANRTTGNQNIWSYGAALALPNVDGKGSVAGLTIGAEPYVGGLGRTPFQLQGFYKYKFSDNLSITPALIYVTATDETNNNNAVIGALRTTFTF
jgi:Carbohydrate-selective porin, OprB family